MEIIGLDDELISDVINTTDNTNDNTTNANKNDVILVDVELRKVTVHGVTMLVCKYGDKFFLKDFNDIYRTVNKTFAGKLQNSFSSLLSVGENTVKLNTFDEKEKFFYNANGKSYEYREKLLDYLKAYDNRLDRYENFNDFYDLVDNQSPYYKVTRLIQKNELFDKEIALRIKVYALAKKQPLLSDIKTLKSISLALGWNYITLLTYIRLLVIVNKDYSNKLSSYEDLVRNNYKC